MDEAIGPRSGDPSSRNSVIGQAMEHPRVLASRRPTETSIRLFQQLLQRVLVRRQEQLVLRTSRRVLRFDDVQQTGGWDAHAFDTKFAPLRPYSFEIKSRHHQREIGLELVWSSHTSQGMALDDTLSEPVIARAIQWFVSDPECESGLLARVPRAYEIVSVGRHEKIEVFGNEDSLAVGTIKVGSGDANQHVPYCPCGEFGSQRREWVGHERGAGLTRLSQALASA